MQTSRTRRIQFLRAERVIVFDCCQSQGYSKSDCVAEGSWGWPESPSTEDACLRFWLDSDAPDGDGVARHWGLLPQNAGQCEGQG